MNLALLAQHYYLVVIHNKVILFSGITIFLMFNANYVHMRNEMVMDQPISFLKAKKNFEGEDVMNHSILLAKPIFNMPLVKFQLAFFCQKT